MACGIKLDGGVQEGGWYFSILPPSFSLLRSPSLDPPRPFLLPPPRLSFLSDYLDFVARGLFDVKLNGGSIKLSGLISRSTTLPSLGFSCPLRPGHSLPISPATLVVIELIYFKISLSRSLYPIPVGFFFSLPSPKVFFSSSRAVIRVRQEGMFSSGKYSCINST